MRVATERRVVPRGPRAAMLSGLWRPYSGTCRFIVSAWKTTDLLSVWNFWPRWGMDQAVLARRWKHSRSIYVSDSWGLGLRPAFPADILNSLRRQAYEALLIRASPIALRAYPQAKSPFPQIDFSEIHGRPIVGTRTLGTVSGSFVIPFWLRMKYPR